MSTLQVVCLISGGKDSLFSILHCLKNGHNVVALANLHPPTVDGADAVEDMDSFMYQTVGHTVIPLYETALGLPLYRQVINGTAVNQEKCYGPAGDDDETEALVPLLRRVMAHHPQVNAISTGAILSDYQRTRVESVALRQGLIPLSYLWQWPNLRPHASESLLHDMATVGQDSRIIKVASGGLDERVLWQNVADPATIARLSKAVQRFGTNGDGAVLGEGGEYETLAIAGPAPLWKGRILVDENERKVIAGEAGSATIQISRARFEEGAVHGDLANLPIPKLLEPRFQQILVEVNREDQPIDQIAKRASPPTTTANIGHHSPEIRRDHILHPNLFGVGTTVSDQMRSIMERAVSSLQKCGHGLGNVVYSSIILRDIADFSSINPIYGACFTLPNPPARATIASASVLPEGKHVMMSLTSVKSHTPESRSGLHVQSRSYWAPANIGPYSQAVSVADQDGQALTYIAGQIPLIPASMELPCASSPEKGAFRQQAVLALQHLDRIGRVLDVGQWAHVAAFVAPVSVDTIATSTATALRVWDAYRRSSSPIEEPMTANDEEDASFDVWHTSYGHRKGHYPDQRVAAAAESDSSLIETGSVRLHIIRVDALPRGSNIEWVAFGASSQASAEIPHFQHLLDVFRNDIV